MTKLSDIKPKHNFEKEFEGGFTITICTCGKCESCLRSQIKNAEQLHKMFSQGKTFAIIDTGNGPYGETPDGEIWGDPKNKPADYDEWNKAAKAVNVMQKLNIESDIKEMKRKLKHEH